MSHKYHRLGHGDYAFLINPMIQTGASGLEDMGIFKSERGYDGKRRIIFAFLELDTY